MTRSVTVNAKTCEIAEPGQPLLGFLRTGLGLTGAKPGCGEGACGACSVLVDGAPVLACQVRVGELAGRSVTTIEGLGDPGPLHPVQRALAAERAAQCGYCTPGIALRAVALLAADPDPDDGQIAAALNPCLCRCGCYPRITRAVHRAAAMIREGDETTPEPRPAPAALARPSRPWDLSAPGERDWFGVLGDGLVVVGPPPSGGAWLHIAPSGAVTAFTGKVDVGQDNQTAFRLLVAEELRADPADVRVVQGDTDVCPYDSGTFGSRSMPDAGEALRRAAAGARQFLASRPPLAGTRRVEVLAAEPELTSPADWTTAGRPHAAPGTDVVTGARRFVSDMELPGMLHGAVLRAPAPAAVLRAVDTGRPKPCRASRWCVTAISSGSRRATR